MRNHLECLSDDVFLDRAHIFWIFFLTFSAERGKQCSCLWDHIKVAIDTF